jgi:branched-chain amino acid aminotransferase
VRVGLAPFVHDPRSPLAGVKTTSYLGRYLQRESAEREGRLDDVLLDLDGQVAEGTVSTLFGVRGGRIVTPPLSAGILAGVTRASCSSWRRSSRSRSTSVRCRAPSWASSTSAS